MNSKDKKPMKVVESLKNYHGNKLVETNTRVLTEQQYYRNILNTMLQSHSGKGKLKVYHLNGIGGPVIGITEFATDPKTKKRIRSVLKYDFLDNYMPTVGAIYVSDGKSIKKKGKTWFKSKKGKKKYA